MSTVKSRSRKKPPVPKTVTVQVTFEFEEDQLRAELASRGSVTGTAEEIVTQFFKDEFVGVAGVYSHDSNIVNLVINGKEMHIASTPVDVTTMLFDFSDGDILSR